MGCYGILLWGTVSVSNMWKILRRLNKILQMFTTCWYFRNCNVRRSPNASTVKDEIVKYTGSNPSKLESHINPLEKSTLNSKNGTRQKRRNAIAFASRQTSSI